MALLPLPSGKSFPGVGLNDNLPDLLDDAWYKRRLALSFAEHVNKRLDTRVGRSISVLASTACNAFPGDKTPKLLTKAIAFALLLGSERYLGGADVPVVQGVKWSGALKQSLTNRPLTYESISRASDNLFRELAATDGLPSLRPNAVLSA